MSRNPINGEFVANASGKKFEKRTPIDNSLVGMVHEAGKPEVDAAVAAARAKLRDSAFAHLSVSVIALEHGFNDLSHFSRAFRLKYGQSPR